MSNTATPNSAPPSPEPVKRSSIGKILRRTILTLFILFVVGLVVLWLSLDTLVLAGVVRGGTYATKQNTSLDAAKLSLVGGTLHLNQLGIDNIKDFSQPKILTMNDCQVTVQSGSVFTHTVIIEDIAIDGLEIWLEQDGMKNNLAELMEAVKGKTPAAGDTSKSSPGKELKIGKLSLRKTKVHIRSKAPLNFNDDFDLPDLVITDPTNPDGRPLKIADLVGKILVQVSKQIMENPRLPPGIRDSMKNVTALVNNLGKDLDKGVKQFSKAAEEAVKTLDPSKLQDAAKNLQGTAKDAGKNLQDAGKNFGNLLNPPKDPPK